MRSNQKLDSSRLVKVLSAKPFRIILTRQTRQTRNKIACGCVGVWGCVGVCPVSLDHMYHKRKYKKTQDIAISFALWIYTVTSLTSLTNEAENKRLIPTRGYESRRVFAAPVKRRPADRNREVNYGRTQMHSL